MIKHSQKLETINCTHFRFSQDRKIARYWSESQQIRTKLMIHFLETKTKLSTTSSRKCYNY